MRLALPVLASLIAAACGRVEPSDPNDGPCAERLDPLSADDRTVFGFRPTQARAALSGPVEVQDDEGASITLTPGWSGGLATQVWAEPQEGRDPPDPLPPLWCEDHLRLTGWLRLSGAASWLPDAGVEVPGVVRVIGPIGALEAAFVGSVDGADLPGLAKGGDTVHVWVSLSGEGGQVLVEDPEGVMTPGATLSP